jgi:mono/diheme cytochrome c family protein
MRLPTTENFLSGHLGRVLAVASGALALAACQPSVEEQAASAKAVIDQYCTGCHNDAERTADFTLERVSLTNVAEHAEEWEAVVKKLRGRMMPPAGEPLPDADVSAELVAYLEGQLDAAATAEPNPGRKSLHRLNRNEYGNAVRDLLGLTIDASAYLPNDSEAYGFDNIADVLGTDPSLMDRYLSAAWKVTSAAMGDTDIAATVATYRVPPDRSQTDHVDGLPFGTRGGLLVRHHFPVDGEYVIKPKLWRNTVDVVRGTETPHDLEVSLDGGRLSLTRFGGPEDEVPAQMFPGRTADEIDRRFETRVSVKAGEHDVGVAFAKKSSAARQEVLQPFQREKHDARMDVGIPELEQIVIEGPLAIAGPGESPSRTRIFTCYPASEAEAAPCAERILSSLARRAYRRPITDGERDRLIGLYTAERAKGRDFEAGVQTALAYILVAPQFLFRVEQDPEGATAGSLYRIGDVELASRLSFFLWSSLPDDELIDLAVAGRLSDSAELERQVKRMLADERATTLAKNFAGQWLYLRNLRAVSPDMYVFPDFDDNLRQSAARETELLFENVVREDRPITELLSADYTYLNERLAKHYGIPGVYGDQFRRVQVTDERRRGLLGQASILTLSSYPNRTSPVSRGNYVLTNILGTPPPEPPPDVPALPEVTGEKLSMRARMERHRADPVCSSCHQLMDPIGLVLESYDGIGRWRTEDNGDPVTGYGSPVHVLRDFGPIGGPVDLRNAILSQPERFVRTATEKLMTYALGRALTPADMPAARAIVRAAAESDYRFSALVQGVVTSDAFQMRIAGADTATQVALD